ncbi:MAG: FHA domain-containing protein [Clostridia bacterium]|nr:FHA domain-containing protein [Clostridia bacterium]
MNSEYLETRRFINPETKACLLIISDLNSEIRAEQLFRTVVIGRKTPENEPDIAIDSPIVSRMHGEITVLNGEYYYRDLNSLNGTYINGKRLAKRDDESTYGWKLTDGDVIRIDRKTLDSPHKDAVTMVFTRSNSSVFNWKRIKLNPESVFPIGRGDRNSINLDRAHISRKHGAIMMRGGKCYVENYGGKNGIAVNNRFVEGIVLLNDRDVIRICDTYMVYEKDTVIYSSGIATGEGLVVDISETTVADGLGKKTLLKDIHAEVNPGDFVLIIGGSGAGKSTFINSVLGKYKIVGDIKVGGHHTSEGSEITSKIAYVPQTLPLRKEERLIDVITDTAILRMNGKMSHSQRKKFIMETLESLGLAAKAKMEIKKLSGGEQRRAAIANEVVTNPDIFFLDEPDSGLDPKSGMELMNNLKNLSGKGKIVMLISHNYASYPNPEKIYTKVIILAKSNRDGVGRLAFMGSVPEALYFFGVKELKDITKLINPKSENGDGRADEFVERFRREYMK